MWNVDSSQLKPLLQEQTAHVQEEAAYYQDKLTEAHEQNTQVKSDLATLRVGVKEVEDFNKVLQEKVERLEEDKTKVLHDNRSLKVSTSSLRPHALVV